MRIYDLKNVSKCYTFGKITSSLPNVLNKALLKTESSFLFEIADVQKKKFIHIRAITKRRNANQLLF